MSKEIVYQHATAQVGDVELHYVRAGESKQEPILLLHGWPQTWFAWAKVIPTLVAAGHSIIAVDLRGTGDSSKPAAGYDSDTVATDIHTLLQQLGVDRVRVVGHDNGGRIAYAYAALFRESVHSLVFLESKVLGIENAEDVYKEYWHFGFHQMPFIAEALTAGREREYLSWFYKYAYNPEAITSEEIDEYVRCYQAPGAMKAGFEYYRSFPLTGEQSREHAKRPLAMPVLAYGGSHSMGTGPIENMKRVATNVTGGVVPECGHWVPDEQPQWIAEKILEFYKANL